MHAFRRALVQASHQVLIDLLRHEGNHGRCQLAHRYQGCVEGHVSIDLILLHSLGPETFTASSYIPVAAFVHKILQRSCCFRNLIVIQTGIHFRDQRIQAAKPLVQHGKLIEFQRIFGSVKIINIGIQYKECVGIPQRPHELTLSLDNRLPMETAGQPGRAA